MGRPRKPTNLLKMSGAFKKHPERLAARANEPTDLPDLALEPPEFISSVEKEAWRYLRARLIPGVAKESDEPAFINLCNLWAQFLAGGIKAPERKQMDVLLGKFGATPSERSKVSAGPKPKGNKFAAIA